MKYAIVSLLMAVTWALLGFMSTERFGRVPYWYLAGSFALTGGLYLVRPSLRYLKNAEGKLTALSWIVFLPYLVCARLSFFLNGLVFRSESNFDLIAENVYLGRWHSARETKVFDHLNIRAILDLTWELNEPGRLIKHRHYLSLPVLDGTAPSMAQLQTGVEWLRCHAAEGPVAVHCALGHGRSATVVVALLLATGRAATVDEAVKFVQQRRPMVALKREQYLLVTDYATGARDAARDEIR